MNLRVFALLFVLPTLVLAGCDTAEPNSDPQIGGTYTGTYMQDGESITLTFVIPNTRNGSFSLTGSGTASGVSINFTGTGNYDFPSITMTITITVTGDTDQMTGTVSSSGDTLTLRDSAGDTVVVRRN